jgi:hypothetical protein
MADQRASSVYSQPGPETLRAVPHGSDRMLSVYSEVSPLTSPRASTDLDHAESPKVSPIEPRPPTSQDFSKISPKPRSQLPIRKVSPAVESDSPVSEIPLDWKGSSTEGGVAQETPPAAELSKEERLANLREKNRKLLSGFQERPAGNSKEMARPQRDDSLDHPVYREPWKGASGRTTLVEPVRNVPRSRNDRGPTPRKKSAAKDTTVHTLVTAPAPAPATPTSSPTLMQHQQTIDLVEEAGEEPIKPVAPLKVGNNTARVRSPVTKENLSGPFNPRYSDATVSSYEPASSESADGSRDDAKVIPATPPRQEVTKASSESIDQSRPPTADEDPSSRFSWTTHGTTSTPPPKTPENGSASHFSWTTCAASVRESPRFIGQRDIHTSPVPPIPYMPNAMAMRQRAIPSHSADTNSISKQKINRKPTPSEISRKRSSSLYSTTTTTTEAQKSPTATMTSPADKSKSLPQCPPELEAKDRIAALEARLEVLTRRRRNINQILKELNNVVQPTSFAYDLATKEEVKKTVKGLEDELSEIRVEEHQIGMTLHRALKKRDQENVYGYPTGLWIKRVTS